MAFPASHGGRPGTTPHRLEGLGVRYRNLSTGSAASACTPRTGLGTLGPLHMVSAADPWPVCTNLHARLFPLPLPGLHALLRAFSAAPVCVLRCSRVRRGTKVLSAPFELRYSSRARSDAFPPLLCCSRACMLCCVGGVLLVHACCADPACAGTRWCAMPLRAKIQLPLSDPKLRSMPPCALLLLHADTTSPT